MTREHTGMPGIAREHRLHSGLRNGFVEVSVDFDNGASEPIATFHERNEFGGRDGTLDRARLFAAAPDMLAALQGIRSHVKILADEGYITVAAYQAVGAAIARATGEEGSP